MILTHGELFAGIGGFGLGFARHGIKTVWCVEIDSLCQVILRRHNPDAEIYGDIKEWESWNLRPVDIISFGSPCQDLSIAGNQEGLSGERSGLFYEAVRIIQALNPRIAVWENVPGALSSNGGADFREVLQKMLNAPVPMPRSGGWADAGMVRTAHVEVAWRVLDAQYFGVAQRRRRVFVVRCVGKTSAAEILFEREGLQRYSAPRREKRAGLTPSVVGSLEGGGAGSRRAHGGSWPGTTNETAAAGHCWPEDLSHAITASRTATGRLDPNGQDSVVGTLDRKSCGANRGSQPNEDSFLVVDPVSRPIVNGTTTNHLDDTQQTYVIEQNSDSNTPELPSLRAQETPNYAIAFSADKDGADSEEDISPTLMHGGDEPGHHGAYKKTAVAIRLAQTSSNGWRISEDGTTHTLDSSGGDAILEPIPFDLAQITSNVNRTKAESGQPATPLNTAAQMHVVTWEMSHASEAVRENGETAPTLQRRMGTGGNQVPLVGVRRLTPVECCRLQGFPDNHLDGESDSAKYRQLGNAVCVNVTDWIGNRIVKTLDSQIV